MINRHNFYEQSIDSDKRRYKENLTTRQGGKYTTEFLLEYEYIESHTNSK